MRSPRHRLLNSRRLTAGTLLAMALAVTTGAAHADCDIVAAQKVYNKCKACHSLDEGVQLMGPSLHGLLGRPAGGVEDFSYSLAMEQADLVWDSETLDVFLASPMTYMPGTTMPFAGLKSAEQRAALLCLFERTPDSSH